MNLHVQHFHVEEGSSQTQGARNSHNSGGKRVSEKEIYHKILFSYNATAATCLKTWILGTVIVYWDVEKYTEQ